MQGDLYDADKDKGISRDEIKFLSKKRNIEDFNIGLEVPSKLLPKNIKGGIVLKETTYKMR